MVRTSLPTLCRCDNLGQIYSQTPTGVSIFAYGYQWGAINFLLFCVRTSAPLHISRATLLLTMLTTPTVAVDSPPPHLPLRFHESDSLHPCVRHSRPSGCYNDLLVFGLHCCRRRHQRPSVLRWCLWCLCRCSSFRRLPLVS